MVSKKADAAVIVYIVASIQNVGINNKIHTVHGSDRTSWVKDIHDKGKL